MHLSDSIRSVDYNNQRSTMDDELTVCVQHIEIINLGLVSLIDILVVGGRFILFDSRFFHLYVEKFRPLKEWRGRDVNGNQRLYA